MLRQRQITFLEPIVQLIIYQNINKEKSEMDPVKLAYSASSSDKKALIGACKNFRVHFLE